MTGYHGHLSDKVMDSCVMAVKSNVEAISDDHTGSLARSHGGKKDIFIVLFEIR